jgi:hypothetical protein
MQMLSVAVMAVLCVSAAVAAQQTAQPAAPAWEPPPPTPGAIVAQTDGYRQDGVEFTLAAGEGMEYKYRLEKGAALLYSWSATGPVHYEMHSVPDGAPSTFAETFDKQDDRTGAHGSYIAPFPGIHGWYWQNRTQQPVTLKMTATGFFSESQEFRKGQAMKRKAF